MKGWIDDGYYSLAAGESSSMPTRGGQICPIGYTCTRGDRTLCPAGKYCDWTGHTGDGVTNPTAAAKPAVNCIAGFYCQAGTNSSRPTDFASQKGGLCPQGYYCPAESGKPLAGGTATGTVCPAGYYSDGFGNKQLDECHTCPPGWTCEGTALLYANIVPCPVNFFCPQGLAAVASATSCTAGNYCPAASKEAIPCEAGKHQAATGQSSCTDCASPYFCPFLTTLVGQVAVGATTSQ